MESTKTVSLSITCVILNYNYLILCQVSITYMSGCLSGCPPLLPECLVISDLCFLYTVFPTVSTVSLWMSFLVITVISTTSVKCLPNLLSGGLFYFVCISICLVNV